MSKQKSMPGTQSLTAPPEDWGLLDHLPDAVVLIDASGVIQHVNQQCIAMFGFQRAELVGQTVDMLVPERLRERHREHRGQFQANAKLRPMGAGLELIARRKDGSEFPVDVMLNPLATEHFGTTLAVVRDVTQRKRMDSTLRNREHELSLVVEQLPEAAFRLDRDLRTTFVSAGVSRLSGRKPEEHLRHSRLELGMPPEANKHFESMCRECLTDGEARQMEFPVDGRTFRIRIAQSAARPGPIESLFGVADEVTHERREMQALRESELQFRQLAETIDAAFYLVDIASQRTLYASPGFQRLWNLAPEWITSAGDPWMALLHPDDRERVVALLANFVSGAPFDTEYRIVLPSGATHWVHDRAMATAKSADGKVRRAAGVVTEITARRTAELQLERATQQLNAALQAGSIVAWEWDLTTEYVNRSANSVEILGFGSGPAAESLARVHPDDRAQVDELVRLARSGIAPYALEFRLIKPDGAVRWMKSQARLEFDAAGRATRAIGVIRDIHERKLREEALRTSESRLQRALRAAHAGAWEWELGTNSILWSPEQYALYGRDTAAGPPNYADWEAMVHAADRDLVRRHVADLQSGHVPSFNISFRVQHPTQGVRWIMSLGELMRDEHGQARRMAGINLDVTELRDAELALEAAKRDAERADASKSRFLAAASHDLRQPLQTINIIVGLLMRAQQDPDSQGHLRTLAAAARSMDDLLAALLDINRLETGAITPNNESFALSSLLPRLRSDLGYVAASKSLTLEVDDCQEIVRSDPALLNVILRNLVGNAIKYTDRGGVRVRFECEADMLRIEVHDTGIGMSREHQQRIFEEFYQVDNPNRDRKRGVGLGLSIVQRIAKLLGHEITVESTEGVGSKFTVVVPRAVAVQEPSSVGASTAMADSPNDTAPPRAHAAAAERRKILQIEDDIAIAKSMVMLLRLEGYEVTSAATAEAALRAIDGAHYRPDLIVTDYQLPGGTTGVEVVKTIAARLGFKPPTILLTGDISERLKEDAALVAERILPKPVDIDRLLSELAQFTATPNNH